MAGPGQSDIDDFMAFTATFDNPQIAYDYLTNNGNELQRAVEEWYRLENPNYYRNRPKHGPANQMQELPPSFEITAPDVGNKSHPPSRPPSRTQYAAEWSNWAAPDPLAGDGHSGVTNTEDVEMQQALERSRLEQRPVTTAAPKILDPEPKARIRQAGQPAFLKPLPNGDFLPSLITILRTISACRNELLSKDDFLQHYQWTEHWWEGEPIQTSRISVVDELDSQASTLEIIHEVQRLIAFLEGTGRAYGSVDYLANASSIGLNQPLNDQNSAFIHFLRNWESTAKSNATQTVRDFGSTGSIFRSNLVHSNAVLPSFAADTSWRILVSANQLPTEPGATLYEALDTALFGQLNEERAIFHQEFPPIVLIVLQPGAINRSISVPEVWYADRYLEQNWDFIKSSRTMIQEELSKSEEVVDKMAQIETFQHDQAPQHGDAITLVTTAMKFLQSRPKTAEATEHELNSTTPDGNNQEILTEAVQAVTQLQDIHNQLQARLKVLNEDKQARGERIHSYAEIGTRPDEPQFPASIKYQLRGVATGGHQQPTVTYALYPHQDDSTNADKIEGKVESEWWKMTYDTRYTASIRNEKITLQQVLSAAGEMSGNTLLVYAHEDLSETDKEEDIEIPPQLKDFIERDNSAFHTEVEDPFAENPVIEGLPVDDGRGFDSGVSSETLDLDGGPGPSIETGNQIASTQDPTRVEDNDIPPKLREMEEIDRSDAFSANHKSKSGYGGGSNRSSMETMNPDSDVDMLH